MLLPVAENFNVSSDSADDKREIRNVRFPQFKVNLIFVTAAALILYLINIYSTFRETVTAKVRKVRRNTLQRGAVLQSDFRGIRDEE